MTLFLMEQFQNPQLVKLKVVCIKCGEYMTEDTY